jgi:NitT/TauT family transport system substrate-binding protein
MLGLAGAALGLSACSGDDKKATPAGAAGTKAGSTEKVTYLTGLGATGRESYAWVAKAKGFFTEQGLDVTIQPGAAGDSNNTLLQSGKAQFASVDSSGAIVRWGTKKDQTFQVVSAVQQQTLIAIVTVEGRGITSPKDLEGKTIAGAPGAAPKTLFPGYARLANIDASKVKFVEVAGAQLIPALAAKQCDALAYFAPGAPGVELACKAKAVILPYSEYASDLFGTFLVASKTTIDSKPDLVHRFNVGLMKGIAYMSEHPDEAGEILNKAVPASAAKVAASEVRLMTPYLTSRGGGQEPLGRIDPARMAKSIALIRSLGLIPDSFEPTAFVRNNDAINSGAPVLGS